MEEEDHIFLHVPWKLACDFLDDMRWRMMHNEEIPETVSWLFKWLELQVEERRQRINLSSSPNTRSTIS